MRGGPGQGIELPLTDPPAGLEDALAECYVRIGSPPIPVSPFGDLTSLDPGVVADAGDVFRAVVLSCMTQRGVPSEFQDRGGVHELVLLEGDTEGHLDTIVTCIGAAKEAERIFLADVAPEDN